MKVFKNFWILLSSLFILLLPFPYFVLNWYSDLLRSLFNPLLENIALNYFGQEEYLGFESDSAGMFIWLGIIALITIIIAFLLKKTNDKLITLHRIFLSYFLGFILLKYGVDKLLLNQFYFPEPNILYSRVGNLDKDILYWTSMGTSPGYSIFMGVFEIISGVLLFFKRTRSIGAFIASFVFINVVMVNFGFDIEVKLLSLFLLGISLYLSLPILKLIYSHIILQKPVLIVKPSHGLISNFKIYSGLKIVVLMVILLDVIGPYIQTKSNFSNELTGTYLIEFYDDSFRQVPKRFHMHSKEFLILEYYDSYMEDYEIKNEGALISLLPSNSPAINNLRIIQSNEKLVFLNTQTEKIFLQGRRLKNQELNLVRSSGFSWVAY